MEFTFREREIGLGPRAPFRILALLVPALIAIAMGGLLLPAIACAQDSAMHIDISRMEPCLAPDDFTFWHTGEGEGQQ